MQSLYIIVAEAELKEEHDLRIASGVVAYRKLLRIKESHPYRNVDKDPEQIPADLPKPQDCRILVCGTSLVDWIPRQVRALEKTGYSPEIDRTASTF